MTTLNQQWTDLYRAGKVRWMAGMRTNLGARILCVDHPRSSMQSIVLASLGGSAYHVGEMDHDERPDWSDPATIGCLQRQAREAWGDPTAHLHGCLWDSNGEPVPPQWTMMGVLPRIGQSVVGWHLTESAAILAAIAAAPRSKP